MQKIALCLILIFTVSAITFANATTENNYNNDTNLLPNIFESTHTENGYKANLIVNPYVTGAYAAENGYKLDLTINPNQIGGRFTENNYQLDLIPENTFTDASDVAVTEILFSKTIVGQGYFLQVNTTLANQAFTFETFHVTVSASSTILKTQTVTLVGRTFKTLTFAWNTTGFAKGNYTLSAIAEPVTGEVDLADNTFVDGKILVTITGDINGDQFVNAKDAVILGVAFGSKRGEVRYTPNADINGDDWCNAKDAVPLGSNFNQSWP
jgi:hypothetical protein